jgi:hypothetical protein
MHPKISDSNDSPEDRGNRLKFASEIMHRFLQFLCCFIQGFVRTMVFPTAFRRLPGRIRAVSVPF